MNSAVKIVVYIIVGATVIALVQSPNFAPAIDSLTGGFSGILSAMRGGGGAPQGGAQTAVQGQRSA